MNIRLSLRTKMMIFAAIIAALPLIVAGQSIIRIAQDELKSSANEQLAVTARQVTDEFNAFFEYSLFTPLDLIRNSIGGNQLGFESKIVILRQGIADLPDVVSLQVNVEGAPKPIVVVQQNYFKELSSVVKDPLQVLRVDEEVANVDNPNPKAASDVVFINETGDWLASASLPIEDGIGNRSATLHARIKLDRLQNYIDRHPFGRTGTIRVMNQEGRIIFSSVPASQGKYDHESVIRTAKDMLETRNATIAVEPFELADGSISLGAIALPRAFPWAILVEKAEADAYRTVQNMIRQLGGWLAAGITVALIGALIFALRISRPILRIGRAAENVAAGDLHTRVYDVKSRDEIGLLAKQFNEMIVQLNERFELQKFVSQGTMAAIVGSDGKEVSLGGERRRTAMLFADIRGYTAFSENRDPEEVVKVLNEYFQRLSDIVVAHHGDIDKFVGDQIMAIFAGKNMSKHAVKCAIEIMGAIDEMASDSTANLRIGIGIDVGEVVVGAMGASHRKDFTVLGDHVNLAARLCSAAEPDETLISRAVLKELPAKLRNRTVKRKPIKVKGKAKSIEIHAFNSKPGAATDATAIKAPKTKSPKTKSPKIKAPIINATTAEATITEATTTEATKTGSTKTEATTAEATKTEATTAKTAKTGATKAKAPGARATTSRASKAKAATAKSTTPAEATKTGTPKAKAPSAKVATAKAMKTGATKTGATTTEATKTGATTAKAPSEKATKTGATKTGGTKTEATKAEATKAKAPKAKAEDTGVVTTRAVKTRTPAE